MPLTWVIGASGMVGRGIWRAGSRRGHDLRRTAVPWAGTPGEQRAALRAAAGAMREEAEGQPWNVVWVAGAGVVGTSPEALQVESEVFGTFVSDLAELTGTGDAPQAMFLASSAGGVYAGSSAPPFTEHSVVAPLAPYGEHKLVMEDALGAFTRSTGIPAMIGRLTNVYGPGQNLAKPQGLISQLGRAYLLRRPISLYVSLDTVRDYIFVDDCASMIVAALEGLPRSALPAEPTVKIIGSGVPLTIASILGYYRRLFRRPPPVVLGDSPTRRFQVRDLRMRSVVWPQLDRFARTTAPAGISATVADIGSQLHSSGSLVRAG